ncbi:pyridoxal-phosphate dependent enzyme [Tropicibacter oceani]|uniref:Pyridoxal-phosphate dependent enzyme n=1 Tax=Tropicibacter oceani TaxID=3058420 RepID=A0ABY8QEL1_9RHOB|nr:pyridoxal-phosphate dependent enzyme [Tropicibacter oceani]WGW03049.1 pyridoxal-phosphate dependent enzyme [Tropicibacter oceani]
MQIIDNPYAGQGLTMPGIPAPSIDHKAPASLLRQCPEHGVTPMIDAQGLARRLGVAQVRVKDERGRMGLGSFKALGAAYVIAHEAVQAGGDFATALSGRCYVTASAGNHGLSVAAGAPVFGARAVVYLSDTVPEGFAARLRAKGAEVVRAGHDYEESMQAAFEAAERNGWTLLSDSSWEGYTALPHRLMEGYLQMAAECLDQIEEPTHILLQAGVGGLAGACAALFRARYGEGPRIIVVEPDAAPALHASIGAGQAVETRGPVSIMGRLDCKAPSLIALKGLSRDASAFALITEAEAEAAMPILHAEGLETSPSGGAGLAAALADPGALGLGPSSRVLAILSEGPDA